MRLTIYALTVLSILTISMKASSAFAADPKVSDLVTQLNAKDVRGKLAATRELAELGPVAASAVPSLTALLNSDDLALQHEAIVALGRIGPEARKAVPALTKLLDADSLIVRHSSLHALRTIGEDSKPALDRIRPLAKNKDPMLNVAAAWALIGIDPDSKADRESALPVLTAGLGDKSADVRNDAGLALSEIGAPAVAAVEAASKTSTAAAISACDVLAAIGPDAKSAVPTLLKLLEDEGPMVSWHAARALGEIGASPETVIPALVKGLQSPVAENRAASAVAIGSYGAAAKGSVAAVAALWKDREPSVRIAACHALGEMGPAAAGAVVQLDKALDDEVGTVTLAAADALGRVGESAVAPLTARLKDPGLRQLAAAVLGGMGPVAKGSVPVLIKLLDEQDLPTRRAALLALASIGPDAKDAAPALRKKLETADDRGRAGAVYGLVKILGKEALPELKAASKVKNNPQLQLASAWGLLTLEPENPEHVQIALPLLIEGLAKAEVPVARKECAAALGHLGKAAESAIPALLKATADPDASVRAEATGALAEVGPTAKGVLENAVVLLDDGSQEVRLAAAYTLGLNGKEAQAGVPGLRQLARSRVPAEHGLALWALVRVAPGKEVIDQAVPVFIRALKHPKPRWRVEAARSLGDVGRGRDDVKKALTEAQGDKEKQVSEAATAALKQLGQ